MSDDRISLGRPDEYAARRFGMIGFGGVAILFLILIPLLLLSPEAESDAAGLSCLLFMFAFVTGIVALALKGGRPDETIVDFGERQITMEGGRLPFAKISHLQLNLTEHVTGTDDRADSPLMSMMEEMGERGGAGRPQFRFARWVARAYVPGNPNPVIIAKSRDVTDLYPTLRRLTTATDCQFTIDNATAVRPRPPGVTNPEPEPDVDTETKPTTSWRYIHLFWPFVIVATIGIVVFLAVGGTMDGADAFTGGILLVPTLTLAYLYAREFSRPSQIGSHRIERTGDQIEYNRPRSSTSWDVDDIDYIIRHDERWFGIAVVGDGVAEMLPCNRNAIDDVHDTLVAMHIDEWKAMFPAVE